MPDVHVHRSHSLGLARAREVARQWADEAARRYDMACAVSRGEQGDTLAFTRSGVTGQLVVSDRHFEVTAQLGFLLKGFQTAVQAEIEKHLDALLARETPPAAG